LAISKQQSPSENQEKLSFFHQAAIKGYETEIANLKKEIEQMHESTKVSNLAWFVY
jgi:hypothetical protein